MSHSNELDNGITVIANGGDLSGDVWFVLPDGQRVQTTWPKTFAAPEMYEVLESAANSLSKISGLVNGAEPSAELLRDVYVLAYNGDLLKLLAKARGET